MTLYTKLYTGSNSCYQTKLLIYSENNPLVYTCFAGESRGGGCLLSPAQLVGCSNYTEVAKTKCFQVFRPPPYSHQQSFARGRRPDESPSIWIFWKNWPENRKKNLGLSSINHPRSARTGSSQTYIHKHRIVAQLMHNVLYRPVPTRRILNEFHTNQADLGEEFKQH